MIEDQTIWWRIPYPDKAIFYHLNLNWSKTNAWPPTGLAKSKYHFLIIFSKVKKISVPGTNRNVKIISNLFLYLELDLFVLVETIRKNQVSTFFFFVARSFLFVLFVNMSSNMIIAYV